MAKAPDIRQLEIWSRRILDLLRKEGTVEISLLSNSELRKLKRRFLKREAKTVDVLSFRAGRDFPRPDLPERVWGEVLLNRALVRSRRRAQGLLIHGILHLLGYDHEKKSDRIKMQKQEVKLLDLLG